MNLAWTALMIGDLGLRPWPAWDTESSATMFFDPPYAPSTTPCAQRAERLAWGEPVLAG